MHRLIQSEPPKKKSSRVKTLDGMRLYIQIWIILGHYWDNRKDEENYLHRMVSRAGTGVTFYIVLSGFMTYIGYRNKSGLEYYSRRLIPMFALNDIALIASLDSWSNFSTDMFWQSFFMISVLWDKMPTWNNPLWTLSTLFFCWLVFPPFCSWIMNAPQRHRLISLPVLFIMASWPWVVFSKNVQEGDGYIGWVRKAPYFRVWDFFLGSVLASLVKEGYSFNWSQSWLWLYASDVAILIILSICAFTPCGNCDSSNTDCECRDSFMYTLIEGPLGIFLWLVVVYGFFYDHEEHDIGIFRRIFNHPVSLTLSKGGTAFCAYCFQDPVASWLLGDTEGNTYPIVYIITLWAIAIMVNDRVLNPISQYLRRVFPTVNIHPGPPLGELSQIRESPVFINTNDVLSTVLDKDKIRYGTSAKTDAKVTTI